MKWTIMPVFLHDVWQPLPFVLLIMSSPPDTVAKALLLGDCLSAAFVRLSRHVFWPRRLANAFNNVSHYVLSSWCDCCSAQGCMQVGRQRHWSARWCTESFLPVGKPFTVLSDVLCSLFSTAFTPFCIYVASFNKNFAKFICKLV